MPAGVPGAGANAHFAAGAVPDPFDQFPITDVPEIALLTRVAEPASVVAVGGGEDQGRKLAMLGALVDFLHEPARVHAGELRIGKLAVADDDDDFLILK